MPVEVKVVVGTNLFYDKADSAAREAETGDLNIFMDKKLVGSIKADHWTSWEAYEEEDALVAEVGYTNVSVSAEEVVVEDETETVMGPDVDEVRSDDVGPL